MINTTSAFSCSVPSLSVSSSPELRVVYIYRITVDAIRCPFVTLLNNRFVVLSAERYLATNTYSFAYETVTLLLRFVLSQSLVWCGLQQSPLQSVENFWTGNIQNVTKLVTFFMQLIFLVSVVYFNIQRAGLRQRKTNYCQSSFLRCLAEITEEQESVLLHSYCSAGNFSLSFSGQYNFCQYATFFEDSIIFNVKQY